MLNSEQNKQSDFVIEKIKERPISRRRLLRRSMITAAMALIFGLIACLTFLILGPVFSNWLYPEEDAIYVEFPEETDEILPEDMIVEEEGPDIQQEVENVLAQGNQIEEVLERWNLDMDHYKQLYEAMDDYAEELAKSVVTITGVNSDTDLFNNTFESIGQVSGILLASNGKEILALADSYPLRQADRLLMTFPDGTRIEAEMKRKDTETGLAVYGVPLQVVPESTQDRLSWSSLGSSKSRNLVGEPVVVLGSPLGIVDSVAYGMVGADNVPLCLTDANYKLFVTDVYGSKDASGVVFNLRGQVIGVITNGKISTKNLITAIGITELRRVITRMSNDEPETYMGIRGVDVTEEANLESMVPRGAYVKEVLMDSPAMLAGIQSGDVIINMEEKRIDDFEDYSTALGKFLPDQTIKVTVMRQAQEEYKEVEFSITLSEKK